MCVCVIDIGQSSHYWNSSAQSRRKGIKNKNENRTSFDDIGTYSASATYCWKIFRLLQAKWVVETLRWIICIMQFLILIISWQTLLYTIIVTFFQVKSRLFVQQSPFLISILHMLFVWISPYLWMRLYTQQQSNEIGMSQFNVSDFSRGIYLWGLEILRQKMDGVEIVFYVLIDYMRCHFVSIHVTMFDGDQQVQFFHGILLQLTLLFTGKQLNW